MSFATMATQPMPKTKEQLEEEARQEKIAQLRRKIEGYHAEVAAALHEHKVEMGKVNSWDIGDHETIRFVDGVSVGLEYEAARDSWRYSSGSKTAALKLEVQYRFVSRYPQNKSGGFNVAKIAAKIVEQVNAIKAQEAQKAKAGAKRKSTTNMLVDLASEYGQKLESYSSGFNVGRIVVEKTDYGTLNVKIAGLSKDSAREVIEALKAAGFGKSEG